MIRKVVLCVWALTSLAAVASADVQVYPTSPHSNWNVIPFGQPNGVMHQVFDRTIFSNATGGLPAQIERIAFSTWENHVGQTHSLGSVAISLGLTARIPGQNSPTGLSIPVLGGGGAPNAVAAMTTFYSNPNYSITCGAGGSESFEMVFTGTPFVYDPSQYNLLVEVKANGTFPSNPLNVSRTAGGPESSRANAGNNFNSEQPAIATRMQFTFTTVPEPASLLVLGLASLWRRRR